MAPAEHYVLNEMWSKKGAINGSPTVGFECFDHSEMIPKLSIVSCQFSEAAEQQFFSLLFRMRFV